MDLFGGGDLVVGVVRREFASVAIGGTAVEVEDAGGGVGGHFGISLRLSVLLAW